MGHPGPSHYGGPGPSHNVVAPLYPSMTPTQPHSSGPKRSRPEELELSVSGMGDLEQSELDSMQSMGGPYAQAANAPTHHHHRLPDQGPPSKMLRRDGEGSIGGGGGGAPSVVGQAGMPAPAPRPRGPKLKFTPEDDQLLIDLKENKSLTWKQIADFFPGRSSGTLQVRYCTKLKAKTTQWSEETVSFSLPRFDRLWLIVTDILNLQDQKLQAALRDWENEKWRFVSNKVGPGFTPQACQSRAMVLSGEAPEPEPDDEAVEENL